MTASLEKIQRRTLSRSVDARVSIRVPILLSDAVVGIGPRCARTVIKQRFVFISQHFETFRVTKRAARLIAIECKRIADLRIGMNFINNRRRNLIEIIESNLLAREECGSL